MHDTDSTKHVYCIKHQKRVRNCFKPMHCFPSLHFCLGLPLFSACGKGMERFAMALAYTRDGCWTPPAFCICHLGVVQERGCSRPEDTHYFGRARAVRLTDWGGGKIPDGTLSILPARQLILHRHVGKGCSSGWWE